VLEEVAPIRHGGAPIDGIVDDFAVRGAAGVAAGGWPHCGICENPAASREEATMLDLLFRIPLWALAILLNVVLGGFAVASVWAYRRWMLPRMRIRAEDAEYSGAVTQSVFVCYGLIAALTAVQVWERYSQVSDIVANEATTIAMLWRDLGAYPKPTRDELRQELRDYTHQVIHGAFPEMKRGRVPTEGVRLVDQFQETLFAFEPSTDTQKILHAEALRAFNQMVHARRQRVDAATTKLPTVLWVVLLPGAFACIALALFFRIEEPLVQYICTVGLAVFIAMVLFVVFSLDRPFVGEMGITADSYQLIYDQLMQA
jgi:hypothetical protein